jgi:hypothetical protein
MLCWGDMGNDLPPGPGKRGRGTGAGRLGAPGYGRAGAWYGMGGRPDQPAS